MTQISSTLCVCAIVVDGVCECCTWFFIKILFQNGCFSRSYQRRLQDSLFKLEILYFLNTLYFQIHYYTIHIVYILKIFINTRGFGLSIKLSSPPRYIYIYTLWLSRTLNSRPRFIQKKKENFKRDLNFKGIAHKHTQCLLISMKFSLPFLFILIIIVSLKINQLPLSLLVHTHHISSAQTNFFLYIDRYDQSYYLSAYMNK